MHFRSLALWLSLGSLTLALPSPRGIDEIQDLVERQDGACTNGPRTRNCWSDGYSIATDFDAKLPRDGETVTVWQLLDRLHSQH